MDFGCDAAALTASSPLPSGGVGRGGPRTSRGPTLPTAQRERNRDAARSWLAYGLSGRAQVTIENYRHHVDGHIVPFLGKKKLRELSVEDVDKWLAKRATVLSTRTVRLLHSLLSRIVKHAQARDKIRRNVVALSEIPSGQ
ncbi:phage integrase central domain-containing protein [Saccharopolyspora sp. MS10]|uniref:phage integrase central domain-containing protein n=1 Tax=Saccharopolyspora sp. MS10 TaxID=3385973 RepID=UPI0039A12EA3